MDLSALLLGTVLGALVGAALLWGATRSQVAVAQARAVEDGASAREGRAAAVAERDVLRARVVDLEASVSEDAQTAATLRPMQDALRRVAAQVETLERDRVDQFATVREVLGRVETSTQRVSDEASSLASSLRVSSVRGAWGETQLRRVLEVSGMLARCDFEEQARGTTPDGASVRPDVVVHLPGGKHLVVDAKAPMSDWLAAQGEGVDPAEHERLLRRHVAALRAHVRVLASKQYWSAFEPSPQMVVCFVPSEATLSAALARDPGLHEEAMRAQVVLTSPGTLLALLRTVAYGWQQDALTRSAQDLLELGRELYQRLSTLGERTSALGRQLTKSVESYNAMVGTLESRVFVSARRIADLGLATQAIAEVEPSSATPRPLSAPELVDEGSRRSVHDELDVAAGDRGRAELDLDLGPSGRRGVADAG